MFFNDVDFFRKWSDGRTVKATDGHVGVNQFPAAHS